MVLGDSYIQATGKKNSRIRLEHSVKQYNYLLWKGNLFPQYFIGNPTLLTRYNREFCKSYSYVRWQSIASPEINEIRKLFYTELGIKCIPVNLSKVLIDPLSIAIWYMDDGYYYKRDKMAYIYLPKFLDSDFKLLSEALYQNFDLVPKLKQKKKGFCYVFGTKETKKLVSIVKPYIIESMAYKLPFDPVSTDLSTLKIVEKRNG